LSNLRRDQEIRTLVASTDLNEYFARDWPRTAQVFRLDRTVIEKGERRTSVVYGFTSLSPKQADPARLLALLRAHWAIDMANTLKPATESGRMSVTISRWQARATHTQRR